MHSRAPSPWTFFQARMEPTMGLNRIHLCKLEQSFYGLSTKMIATVIIIRLGLLMRRVSA
jgi:hypothetical protein